MGSGMEYECEKCGFVFRKMKGVGMMFPKVYVDTLKKAKDGEFGTEIQEFFKEYPDGAINAEIVTLCCDDCGHLTKDKDLTTYVLKKGAPEKTEHIRWSVAMEYKGANYVTKEDLKQNYKKYKKYTHKCEKCGGNMHKVKKRETLICPRCKIPMTATGAVCWD